jgi:hypothetical protein
VVASRQSNVNAELWITDHGQPATDNSLLATRYSLLATDFRDLNCLVLAPEVVGWV